MTERQKRPLDGWCGSSIQPGDSCDLTLPISESYSGMTVGIPLHVRRGVDDGPVVFITAALHGDEINGTGTVRALLRDPDLRILRGAVIFVPVLNVLGFDRHSRYLPDRRDLNRSFPGSAEGSQASRMARTILDEIVARADFGIDLHTAAVRRTNFPNIRADMSTPAVQQLAVSFGAEFILDGAGPDGSFRREACKVGCPTIVLEAGEVWKVEPSIVEHSVRGIKNVLAELHMVDADPVPPPFQYIIQKTKWLRAERGGFLEFHAAPGNILREGQPIATNTSLLGHEQRVLASPFDAVIIGMTTLPAVGPGEPVCRLGRLEKSRRRIERILDALPDDHPHEQVSEDLKSNVRVVAPERNSQSSP